MHASLAWCAPTIATLGNVVSTYSAMLHAALNLLRCTDNPAVAEGGDKGWESAWENEHELLRNREEEGVRRRQWC
jgi:hypothetical protein